MIVDYNTLTLSSIKQQIASIREKKGSEKDALLAIKSAQSAGHDFTVNLLWEEALIYQHLIMNEDSKGDEANESVRRQYLLKMEETVGLAKYYIVRFNLDNWKHRLYRFIGRVYDYKGRYKEAIDAYKKSIKYSSIDPDFLSKQVPRILEVRGFLATSLIMAGQHRKGVLMAMDVYSSFDTLDTAKELKKVDPYTWLVWKTGIPIRVVNALISKNINFDKDEMVSWLGMVEKDLKIVPNNKIWGDLSHRKSEVQALKLKLASN